MEYHKENVILKNNNTLKLTSFQLVLLLDKYDITNAFTVENHLIQQYKNHSNKKIYLQCIKH